MFENKKERMSVEEIMDRMKETIPADYMDDKDINSTVLTNLIFESQLPGIVKSDCFGDLLWLCIRAFIFGYESREGTFFK